MGKFLLIAISPVLVYLLFLWLEEKIYKSNFREDYYTVHSDRTSNGFRIVRIAIYILWLVWVIRNGGTAAWIHGSIPLILLIAAIFLAIMSAKEKLIVMDDCLEIHRAFKQVLYLNISEIDKIEVEHVNNSEGARMRGKMSYTIVRGYSKENLVFEINSHQFGYKPFCEKLCKMGLVEPSQLDRYK